MIVKKEEGKGFLPFTLEITVETLEEAKDLSHRTKERDGYFLRPLGKPTDFLCREIFDAINVELRKQGLLE